MCSMMWCIHGRQCKTGVEVMSRKFIRMEQAPNRDLWIALLVISASSFASTIGLYVHISSQTCGQLFAIHQEMTAINQEMRDFHSRIEKVDVEFKNHIIYLHKGTES